MSLAKYTVKYCRWLLFLAACIACGCTSGPQPQKGIWPWEYGKDYGNRQTGDYIAVSGSVAQFGETPKAVKPIRVESLEAHSSDAYAPSGTSKPTTAPAVLPRDTKLASGKKIHKVTREYDFSVAEIKNEPPSYLPTDSVPTTYDITAFNHGQAPVTLIIGVDPNSSQNLSPDKTLPLTAVIAPHTDQTVVRIGPKVKHEAYKFNYTYSWSIGDYRATHHSPEQYRFPFGDNIRAIVGLSDNVNATPYTRHAVMFSLPVGTPILAARKGVVIQIKADDRVDILHDDSTVATYSHLGKIAEGIIVGKIVSTEDSIGIVGVTGSRKEAYLQLSVWRPEPVPIASLKTNSPGSGLEHVSFPLEFCSTGSKECRALTQGQSVSRNYMAGTTKQGKRKSKPIARKDDHS